ncbi:glycosyltransferase family 32 protein [Riemerella columbipharyngis]|uniref:Glycosyltransferase sugar-binding region containing DXD motif-containing protein n=1 Tax=Riemerella columbipharyngis TaxID=1071918 RepID=A0A1G7BLB7_9FLAO|nr:glycosyltransferase [Riemerella columbipharyngis]SDE27819.1 Glycosyltransferase sugar-binding region containing DXD motif-containing protein [Riemerella columbipharyngis]
MAIPKNIFQTFKTDKLPWITRFYISRMKKKNPKWSYHFYNDKDILDFFEQEFPSEYLKAYKSLTIGAAKADFFRYAILYKKGGLYLDIDSYNKTPLDHFIMPEDEFIITKEGNPGLYCQWGIISNKNHPFLKRTLEKVLDNIENHRFPNDVHKTTGPTVYTNAINEILKEQPNIPHRFLGIDFEGHLRFKYKLGRIFLYGKKSEHWKKKQLTQDIIIPFDKQ